jgi:hypothetical protein
MSLGLTLLVEVPVAFVVLRFLFKEKNLKTSHILFVSFLASILTLPYLWFVLSPYVDAHYYLVIGESLVFLIEAVIYWRLFNLKIGKALLLSLLANFLSYYSPKVLALFF